MVVRVDSVESRGVGGAAVGKILLIYFCEEGEEVMEGINFFYILRAITKRRIGGGGKEDAILITGNEIPVSHEECEWKGFRELFGSKGR